MAQTMTIQLTRSAGQPWGFRLQGGLDFASPLTVLRVNVGSPSEAAGLQAGDTILQVNRTDVLRLRHQEALDLIAKAGNQFELLVTRAEIWKPLVTPLDQPIRTAGGETLLTKTSLARHHEQETSKIGSAHNAKAAPFSPASSANKKVYSEETIAETLTSQAEVLKEGVVGVNFKKNEKVYDSAKSQVFKMLQELDKEPKEPQEHLLEASEAMDQSAYDRSVVYQSSTSTTSSSQTTKETISSSSSSSSTVHHFGQQQQQQPYRPVASEASVGSSSPQPGLSGVRSVAPPVPNKSFKGPEAPAATADNPRCGECDRLIVGVFVRLKDKNLHVECFRCSTCGTSLKNVGYFKINNKLYCDIHAKMVARNHAPDPDLTPVALNPGSPIPRGAVSTDSATRQLSASLSSAMSSASGVTPPPGGVRLFPAPFMKH